MFHRAWDTCERPKGVRILEQDLLQEGIGTALLIDGREYFVATAYRDEDDDCEVTKVFPMFQFGPWVFDGFPNWWGSVELAVHEKHPLKGHMDVIARIEKEGAYWK